MKIIRSNYIFLFLALFINVNSVDSQEIWNVPDNFKQCNIYSDIEDENTIKVNIQCSEKNVNDLMTKAKKIAFYEVLFSGFKTTGNGSGMSAICDKSDYDGVKKEWFIKTINEKYDEFIKNIELNTNASNRDEKVDGLGKVKIRNYTVDIMVNDLRLYLEKEDIIVGLSKLEGILGKKPVILVKPDDIWLKGMGLYKVENNQNRKVVTRQYDLLGSEFQEYNAVLTMISSSLGDGFTVQSYSNMNDEVNSNAFENNANGNEATMQSIDADLYLEISLVKNKINGESETQYQITVQPIDAYTKDRGDFKARKALKVTNGDDSLALINSVLKPIANDLKYEAMKYLIKRSKDGLPGVATFELSTDLAGEFDFYSKFNGKALNSIVFQQITKSSKQASPTKQDAKMLNYKVKLDAKTQIDGTPTANDFNLYSNLLVERINREISDAPIELRIVKSAPGNVKFVISRK